MTELTNSLPRKSSRTSTHAIAVPVSAFTSETMTAQPSVSFSAATDWGFVTSCQNVSHPAEREVQTSAASGTSTTRLRYPIATPRASAPVADPVRARNRGRAAVELVANDPVHQPVRVVEEAVLHRLPPA